MATATRTRRILILAVVLAIAGVIAVITLESRSGSSAMPGMDMSAPQMPKTAPPPAANSHDMPGMDMPAEDMPKTAPPLAAKSGDMPGMDMPGTDHTAEPAQDRPLAPVLGVFGGGASAVMLSAGLMRRQDRAAKRIKEAARAARRAQK